MSVGIVLGILVRPERSFGTAVDGVLDVLEVGGGKSLGSVDFNADPPAVLISADRSVGRIPVKRHFAFVGDIDFSLVAVVDRKTGVGDDFGRADKGVGIVNNTAVLL